MPLYRKRLYLRKGLFIHIPKNAGTSVVSRLYGKLYRRSHTPVYIFRALLGRAFNRTFKFCVVRQPEDRMYSLYNYLLSGGNGTTDKALVSYFANNLSEFDKFIEFIYSERLYCWHPMFLPQFFWISIDGEVAVDKVFYMENLKELEAHLGGKLPSTNVSQSRSLSICESSRAKILEMYQVDFREFFANDNCR